MKMIYHKEVVGLGLALLWPALSFAGPLTEARVTAIVNQVKVSDPAAGDRAARIDDIIQAELALMTGIKSRSELTFQDNTLTRLGPESYFSFKSGTRDMTLQRGTLLLQVPKGIGGAKIHTASVTAAITGTTIMMEYVPQQHIKVLVLEGSLRLSMNGRFGDSLLLLPGKMVIMPPNAKRIPDPVTVDLKKVVQTSTLVNMGSGKNKIKEPLPSMPLIESEIAQQQQGKDSHHLVDTNLVILGKGTNVLIGSDQLMDDLSQRTDLAKLTLVSNHPAPQPTPPPTNPDSTPFPTPKPIVTPSPTGTPSGTATPSPTATVSPTATPSTPTPTPFPTATPLPPYTINGTTVINTINTLPKITTNGISNNGLFYQDSNTNGSPTVFLFGAVSDFDSRFGFDAFYLQYFKPSAVFNFDALQLGGGITFHLGPVNNVTLIGATGITGIAGSAMDLSGINDILFATAAGNITLASGLSFNTTTNSPNLLAFYARGGGFTSGSTFNLPNSSIQVAAENNALFTSTGSVTAANLDITGLQTVQFDGSANVGSVFQLNGGDVELGGSVTTKRAYIYGSSATINGTVNSQNLSANVTGDFVLNNPGLLNSIGTGAEGTVTLTVGGNLTLDGRLNAQQANLQSSGNFLLGAPGTLTIAQDVTIGANGGGITLNGALNSGHNVTLTATGNIAINQAPSGFHQLDITGGSVSFGTNLTLTTSGNELTATNGDITATGRQLIGFDQITLTNANLLAGGITANNLVIHGSGDITIANNLTLAHTLAAPGTIDVGGLLSVQTITAGDVTANALHTSSLTSSGVFTLGSSDLAPIANNNISISAPTVNLTAGANLNGQNGTAATGPASGNNLTMNTGAFTLASAMSLNGGDGAPTRTDAGGNGGQLNLTSTGAITLDAPISATTGQNSLNGVNGGSGGTVNLTANNTITLNNKIEVSSNSGRRRSNNGGNINVTSNKTSGTAIAVNSSAQLLALLNATAGGGGSIKFVSAGGDVNVNNAAMQADHGSIELRNNGTSGVVTLNNATLNASTVKAGALGNNGTLNVGGGTISADTLIRLYAGGSNGTVNFTNNVTLNGNSVKQIAGDTVSIFNGKVVTIGGTTPANVFTNHPNYTGFGGNGSTTGTFAGQGATTSPLSLAPGF
jgi:hypothetical protein